MLPTVLRLDRATVLELTSPDASESAERPARKQNNNPAPQDYNNSFTYLLEYTAKNKVIANMLFSTEVDLAH